eukprot:508532-Rhodomonas_salina.1
MQRRLPQVVLRVEVCAAVDEEQQRVHLPFRGRHHQRSESLPPRNAHDVIFCAGTHVGQRNVHEVSLAGKLSSGSAAVVSTCGMLLSDGFAPCRISRSSTSSLPCTAAACNRELLACVGSTTVLAITAIIAVGSLQSYVDAMA